MKILLFIITIFSVSNIKAAIPVCSGTSWNGAAALTAYNFAVGVNNQFSCNDSQPFGSLYLKSEIDDITNKFNTDLTNLNKSNESLKKRMFVVEQALAQDVVIPDSQLEQIKNDLRAELKNELKEELKKEIIQELKNSN